MAGTPDQTNEAQADQPSNWRYSLSQVLRERAFFYAILALFILLTLVVRLGSLSTHKKGSRPRFTDGSPFWIAQLARMRRC